MGGVGGAGAVGVVVVEVPSASAAPGTTSKAAADATTPTVKRPVAEGGAGRITKRGGCGCVESGRSIVSILENGKLVPNLNA